MSGKPLISNFMYVVLQYCSCYKRGTEESADMTKLLCVFCRCFSTSTTKINACSNIHPSAGKIGAVACVCRLYVSFTDPSNTKTKEYPENGCTRLLRNVGTYLPKYTAIIFLPWIWRRVFWWNCAASNPRRPQFSFWPSTLHSTANILQWEMITYRVRVLVILRNFERYDACLTWDTVSKNMRHLLVWFFAEH